VDYRARQLRNAGRRTPTNRYTYGFGRVEDLACIAVVLTILFSAVYAGYESVLRLVHPQAITHVGLVAIAAVIIGFLGNEAVAQLRIRTGRRIPASHSSPMASTRASTASPAWRCSPVLRAYGWAIRLPTPSWESPSASRASASSGSRPGSVLSRAIDGVDPEVVDEIDHAVGHTPGVVAVTERRVRWLGHRMHAEVNVTVAPG
jgi:divalent metal cation (Fe/Co/Zn/Cd) transporter